MAAKHIFVSTKGRDTNSGTISAPVKTLEKAVDLAKPGDIIELRGGTYAGGMTINKPKITIQSYGNEKAVISTPIVDREESWFGLRFGAQADGSVLNKVEVKGGFYYAIKFETEWEYDSTPLNNDAARNITIMNSKFHDSGRDVIKLTPGVDGIKILNNEIYNSGRFGPDNAEGIDIVNGDGTIIKGNFIHHTATSGLYTKGGGKSPVIESNLIMNVGQTGHKGGGNSGAFIGLGYSVDPDYFDPTNKGFIQTYNAVARNNVGMNSQDAGIMVYGSYKPVVTGNEFYNVGTKTWIADAGIYLGGLPTYVDDNTELYVKNVSPTVTRNFVLAARDSDPRPGYVDNFAISVLRDGRDVDIIGRPNINYNTYARVGGNGDGEMFGGDFPETLGRWRAELRIDLQSKLGSRLFLNEKNPVFTKILGGNNSLKGGVFDDILFGAGGNDTLFGLQGSDTIVGGTGNDGISGSIGDDLLKGGLGRDRLTGSTGRDTFWFDAPASAANADIVRDFLGKDDSIWLDNAVFAGIGSGTLDKPKHMSSAFLAFGVARDANDRIVYDKATGTLSFDADGNGLGQAVVIATFDKRPVLTALDFYVV